MWAQLFGLVWFALSAVAFAQEVPPKDLAEKHQTFRLGPGVRAHFLSPTALRPNQPVKLVIYALPNGHTIEQTLGRADAPGQHVNFTRQHIAAQTRFVRAEAGRENLVLACVEASGLAWPAWRRSHGNAAIVRLVESLVSRFEAKVEVTLSAHSGGGSFIFGFLEAVPAIPSYVERIAFLDATYAYETERHAAKLASWLGAGSRDLCVLAYRDDRARYQGKPFVSATGGTGYRSKLMLQDLARSFRFSKRTEDDLRIAKARGGAVQFLIHENSAGIILHTVQVERNGFIHALLSGTRQEGREYQYMGEPAYTAWISSP
jgi:hypothetical protein